jgi:hypothetical protein
MIDLRIGQFRLASDGTAWTVTRVAIAQKGDNIGAERDTEHGYHMRLSHALLDVFDRLNGSEDAESVEALRTAVDTHARAIVESVAELERQLTAMRRGEG